MEYTEFAQSVKAKYPEYADMDDRELASAMVAKFPNDYQDVAESLASAEPMDLLIEQPSDRQPVEMPDVGMRVGGVNLPSTGTVSTAPSGPSAPMGLGEGLDWGDPVQMAFPLAWSGAEQGAGPLEMMGRGTADAALMLAPGATAAKVAPKAMGTIGTRAIEAGIGVAGSAGTQAGFEGKVDPLAVMAYGAAPFVFPAAGAVASAPSKAVGGAMQATGRAVEQAAPKTSAVLQGVGKTIQESETPIVGNLERITTEKPWRKSAQMQKVGDQIGVKTEELSGPFMGPKSHSAQLQREAHLNGDAKVQENVEIAQNKLQRSLKQDIGAINAGAQPLGVADAGAMLQEIVPQAKMMAIQQNATRYATVAKQYPDIVIDPKRVDGIFDLVSDVIDDEASLSKLGFNTAPFADVQQALVNNPSFANLNKLRNRIGQVAYAKNPDLLGVSSDMVTTLKKVYAELSSAMTDAVKAYDPKLGDELVESNRSIAETMKQAKQLQPSIGNEFKSEEGVLNSVFNSRKNVSALKKLLPKQHFDSATQAWVAKMARNAEDDISYGTLAQRLSEKRDVLNVALDPETLLNLRRKSEFGKILNQTYPVTGRDRSEMAFKGILGQVVKPTVGNVEGAAADIAVRAAQRKSAGGPMAYPTFGATLARAAYPENFSRKDEK